MWPNDKYGDSCAKEIKKAYRIVIMDADGKVSVGRFFDNWDELNEAVTELRVLYAKHGVKHQVGYMEV